MKEDDLTSQDPFEKEELRTKLIRMIKIKILWWCATGLVATPQRIPAPLPSRERYMILIFGIVS